MRTLAALITWQWVVIFGIALIFACLRMTIHTSKLRGWPGIYEAMAHMFVGSLVTMAILSPALRPVAIFVFFVLGCFELFAFLRTPKSQ